MNSMVLLSSILPVVVLTASGHRGDVQAAHRLHVDSPIAKPVDFARCTDVAGQIEPYRCHLNQLPC